MEQFITWADLLQFATMSMVVFSIVNFTKEIPYVKLIPTKYFSWIIAFVLILILNIHDNTFVYWDIILYAISAMFISLSSNGIANFNDKKVEPTTSKK